MMSWSKAITWIVIIALGAGIFLVVFNAVKKQARPLVMSPGEFQQLEQGELTDESDVIITWGDNTLHRRGCPRILGAWEKAKYKVAKERNLALCPYCIGGEE